MLAKFKKKYIGDWDFYQKYLLLAIPMILQNAITNLVSFLDNIMVGQLGTEQMSGVAIVNQLPASSVPSISEKAIIRDICIPFGLSCMPRCW